jgi:ABC-2 type transport system permease protein
VQGFHAVMNLLLVPMWLLSGAFFPPSGAPPWLAALMRANPLTYGVSALRWALYGPAAPIGTGMPGPRSAMVVTVLIAALAFGFDLLAMRGSRGRVE